MVEVVQILFFVSGTSIETTNGSVLIENITAGMYVHTHDYGLKMVRWIGNSTIFNNPKQCPIRIKEGSFGATSDLLVSPQHRVLVEGCWGEPLFGETEVLVKAKDLIHNLTVTNDYDMEQVTYHHMLFDRH